MTNMNYFEYQYGQTLNMTKFNHEKDEICLFRASLLYHSWRLRDSNLVHDQQLVLL